MGLYQGLYSSASLEIPWFYGSREFIITYAKPVSLFSDTSIQSTMHNLVLFCFNIIPYALFQSVS
jgi:hypothetical protein